MKQIIEFLQKKNLIFKSFKEMTPKVLGSRKRVTLYLGVDLKGYYALVMALEKKSRVLSKEAQELIALHQKAEEFSDTKIKKKYILIKAPLCSKAKALLEENGWKIWHEEE